MEPTEGAIAMTKRNPDQTSLRHAPSRAGRAWVPLLVLWGLYLAAWGLLRWIPFDTYWVHVFERGGVWTWWPFLLLIATGLLPLIGVIQFNRTGLPQFAPGCATGVLSVLLLVCCWLVTDWSVDWPGWLALLFLAVAALLSPLIALGWVSYVEAWRRQCHTSIVSLMDRALENGDFERYLAARHGQVCGSGSVLSILAFAVGLLATAFSLAWGLAHGDGWPFVFVVLVLSEIWLLALTSTYWNSSAHLLLSSRWGSRHCLQILLGRYEQAKRDLICDLSPSQNSPTGSFTAEHLAGYRRVADALMGYLSLDWAPEVLSVTMRSRTIADIRREMTTCYLWARRTPGLSGEASAQDAPIRQWIAEFTRHAPQESDSYARFMASAFELATRPSSESAETEISPEQLHANTRNDIRQIHRLYQDLVAESNTDHPAASKTPGHPARLQETCACTWLALAPASLDPHACLDVWMAFRQLQGTGLFVAAPRQNKALDPACVFAQRRLCEVYTALRETTPEGWQGAFEGRHQYAQDRADHPIPPEGIAGTVTETAISIHSWPYVYVWRCVRSRALAACIGLLVFIIFAVAIIASNPRVGLPSPLDRFGTDRTQWNTLDHVEDRRAMHDYTRKTEFRAMVPHDEWVALGTDQRGLVLFNKDSRILREKVTPGPVQDLARGRVGNDFLVLEGNLGLTELGMEDESGSIPHIKNSIPPPQQPFWPASGPATPPAITANALDDLGWLVIASGRGVARYPFSPTAPESDPFSRSRSWQTGPFCEMPVDKAVITHDAVWISHLDGGIACADRSTLRPMDGRSVATPPIARLEAGHDGAWACAVDARGGFWCYSQNHKSWFGPFLAVPDSIPGTLAGPSDVQRARMVGETAWLGTPYGLFAYRMRQRVLSCVIPEADVLAISPLNDGRAPTDGAGILVAGNKGLYRVKPEPSGGFGVDLLDRRRVLAFGLSPDEDLCAYRAAGPRREGTFAQEDETCVLSNPSTGVAPTVVVPAHGLDRAGAMQPEVTAVIPVGDELLFTTSAGAFFYDPQDRSYTDCSDARVPTQANDGWILKERQLSAFTAAGRGGRFIWAIAEGRPLVLETQPSAPRLWECLELADKTDPSQIIECGEQILGLRRDGEIYRYRFGATFSPKAFCTGRAPSLENNPPSETEVLGDLLLNEEGQFRLAFIHGGRTCFYDGGTAHLYEQDLPVLSDNGASLKQVRLTPRSELLCVLSDGRLAVTRGGQVVANFGLGALPFPPEQATAIAPAPLDEDRVLVAGPGGDIAEYEWLTGSWRRVGSGPVPLSTADKAITHILPHLSGTFVITDLGRTFFSGGPGRQAAPWSSIGQVTRITTGPGDPDVWTLDENGIQRMTIHSRKPIAEWNRVAYCTGPDMEAFVHRTTFLWRPRDASHIVLFTGGSDVGIYDSARETFEVRRFSELTAPVRFASGPADLLIQDGMRILHMGNDLAVRLFTTVPTAARSVSLHVNDSAAAMASVEAQTAVLRCWPDMNSPRQSSEYRRGGSRPPNGFDVASIVHADTDGAVLILVDSTGAIAAYDPRSGAWQGLRTGDEDQELYGWIPRDKSDVWSLILKNEHPTSRVVTLQGTRRTFEEEVPVPPAGLATYYAQQARELAQRAKASDRREELQNEAKRYQVRADQHRKMLRRPAEGELLHAGGFRVVRQRNATRYALYRDGQWQPLTPTRDGFLEDSAQAVAFAPSGKLWVLQQDRLDQRTPADAPGYGALAISRYGPSVGAETESMETSVAGDIVVHLKAGGNRIYIESNGGDLCEARQSSPRTMATIDYASHRFVWTVGAAGRPTPSWVAKNGPGEPLPLWGKGGKLAIQSTRDMAVCDQTDLLLATEAGLIVRDPATFGLKAIFPQIRNARLQTVLAPGARQTVLIELAGGRAYKWENRGLVPLPGLERSSLANRVRVGPWDWMCPLQPDLPPQMTIRDRSGRSRRSMQAKAGEWRFADDCVNWVARDTRTNQLWTATHDGLWPLDPIRGRIADQEGLLAGRDIRLAVCRGGDWRWMDSGGGWNGLTSNGRRATGTDPSGQEETFRNPAFAVSCGRGNLRFTPFDGTDKSTFRRGRFFFDDNERMCSYEGSIFALAAERCVLRRDGADPARITGCWPLPPGARAPCSLEADADGIRLETRSEQTSADSTGLAWSLMPDALSANWRSIPPQRREVPAGPVVTWRLESALDDSWKPVLYAGDVAAGPGVSRNAFRTPGAEFSPLHWWNGNRFVWDKIISVGAMNNETVVLLSPLGPELLRRMQDGGFQAAAFWHIPDLDYCEPGWVAGRNVGLVVGRTGADIQYHLRTSDRGDAITATSTRGDEPLTKRAILRLEHIQTAEPSIRHIGLVEHWQSYLPGATTSRPAILQSGLPQLPTEDLLYNGRFAFDCVSGACEIQTGGSKWLTFFNIEDRRSRIRRICANHVEESTSLEPALRLLGIWAAGDEIRALRPAGNGRFFGCFASVDGRSSSGVTIREGAFDREQLTWSDTDFAQASRPFQTGQHVVLSVPEIRWLATPRYVWDQNHNAFEARISSNDDTQPSPRYDVFVPFGQGHALAFDVMTSVSTYRPRNEVAIGTLGGVWITAYKPDANLLTDDRASRLIVQERGGSICNAGRVRYADDGSLFMRYTTPRPDRYAKLSGGVFCDIPAEEWPAFHATAEDHHISVVSSGLEIDGLLHRRSNDAWGLGRRRLTDIVDLQADTQEGTLWVCTKTDGLFRILLSDIDDR